MQNLRRFLGQSPYLEITKGSDLQLDEVDAKSLPYQHIKNLGSGGSAIVEKVRDLNTGLVYARKTFRSVSHRDRKKVREQFHNEVKVMRRLCSHPHTTTLFATYSTSRELVIIVSPVADGGNLADFLENYRNWGNAASQLNHSAVLKRAFVCLASGLAFMHRARIRHKDIKPENILVHDGNVLYTDFGISRDFLQARSTTCDNPGPFTRRYCAPEVADWDDRNRSADIFSLGCVFLEILVALFPRIAPPSILEGIYHVNVQEGRLPGQLEFSNATPMVQSTFRHLIYDMLRIVPAYRPSALEVMCALMQSDWGKTYQCQLCANYLLAFQRLRLFRMPSHFYEFPKYYIVWLGLCVMSPWVLKAILKPWSQEVTNICFSVMFIAHGTLLFKELRCLWNSVAQKGAELPEPPTLFLASKNYYDN